MFGDTPLKMIPERFNRKVPGRQQNPVYAGMMENLDRNIGKVIDALDELGLTKDTIIVFTSDNGGSCMPGTPEKRPTSNYPLRASKGWNYEGGIRIPTFITWPGKIPAMKTDEPVITMDLYPTLLELTGCKQLPRQTIDGHSLVPLIHGKTKTLGPALPGLVVSPRQRAWNPALPSDPERRLEARPLHAAERDGTLSFGRG